MTDTTLIELSRSAPRNNPLGALARQLVFTRLATLHEGRLRVREGDQVHEFGNERTGVEASITVLDPAFYAEIAFGGSVGAGESYMLGHWQAEDLTRLMRLLLRNRHALDAMESGLARLSAPIRMAAHWLHRNTHAGSRRNISAHYDLGNEFFRLFLDETLMYSCALFECPEMTLAQASTAKLDAICRKLALSAQDHVLEIGTGWGGFALHAAAHYGCRVTTTTISPGQHELANARVRAAGLGHRITVLLEDYRDLKGSYDKLVSIEMIEAIGHQYFAEFFRRCAERLIPGGRMLLQSITIADRHYVRARDDVDFIKRYIFPGCCIPAVSALAQAMADSSDLRIVHLEDIGAHYATTLARWRDNFLANLDQVHALGYPESFCRMWEFYLSYCEAGFAERALGDVQMLIAREG
ncbi:MAG: cyclopropane-fatty-acyl-phospholipid synthase family protein [Betaproteobacteria bacterium]|nr:cyclopropane-fatty-acyl-phospholipid synthase family protein [Betaproteobacteria bacterium]